MRRQKNRGIFFSHSFGSVADIFDCRQVGQKEVKLINGSGCFSRRQELVVHIGQDIEKHRIFQFLVRLHQPLDTEDNKLIVRNIGMPVEKLAFGSDTHGVQSETKLAEQIFCEQRFRSFLVLHILAFHNLVQIRHYGIIPGSELRIIRVIMDAEFAVEPCQENFKRVDLCIVKIFVNPEEILQK